ncbi:hypothetical protein SAMN04488103_102250 [Gemmobacter aquatilis]|uniref:Uncharacterized protein n=1 Tax=Gemmobacter aquatilis TaxID=933059 RepID=A0A1H8BQQ0_9RHOB|nr:hypothetical protein [Gemmobacter aquatilis]SEM85211.1 hypothetical protein SAMN04488103_102250 [Gemmobacter aquatilis]
MTTNTRTTAPQAAPLIALLEEMQALMGILPVKITPTAPVEHEGRADVVASEQDAVVEMGFDNMPV